MLCAALCCALLGCCADTRDLATQPVAAVHGEQLEERFISSWLQRSGRLTFDNADKQGNAKFDYYNL